MKKQFVIFIFHFFLMLCSGQEKMQVLDKELSTVKYPYPVHYLSLVSQKQNLRMAYMDVSPIKGNGKTVLLLHGKNFNGAYWQQTIKALTKKGYRVIVPDQIGFGKSSKPENYQYSFHQLAFNTQSILNHLKIKKVFVLGHSMGGMLAARFSLIYPERTEKLILENPIGLEDYKILSPYQSIEERYQEELKYTREDYKAYQLKFYYDNRWKKQYEPWLNLLAGWTISSDYPIIAWNAALTTDMIYNQPVVYEFGHIKCPVLLIIGTRDRTAIGKARASKEMQNRMGLYNILGRTTQRAIPGAQLVEIENIGHLPHIEAFGQFFLPLLNFLEM